MKPNHLWALVVFSLLNNGLAAQHKDSLLVDCKNALTQQLIRDPKDFSQVEFVQIVGLDVSCDWNEIFNSLSQLPQLRSLVMDRNALNNLPDGVQKLKTLESIAVFGNEDLDADSAILLLQSLPNIKNITWELSGFEEVPFDITDIPTLETFTVISDVFSERRISPLVAEKSKTAKIETIDKPRDRMDSALGKVVIRVVTPKDLEYKIPPDFVASWMEQPSYAGSFLKYSKAKSIAAPRNRFAREYKSFKRPVDFLDIPMNYYSCPPNEPVVIEDTRSGTQIIIPPNAFVDKEGNRISEEVVIEYREFRDAVDFILSGIPMSFEKKDELSFFQSGGMFEINAFRGKEEVFMNPSAPIRLNFMSTDSIPGYRFYQYDDANGQWMDNGMAAVSSASDLVDLNPATAAIRMYKRLLRDIQVEFKLDSTLYNDRYNSVRYGYEVVPSVFMPDSSAKLPSHIWIDNVKKVDKGNVVFQLSYYPGTYQEIRKLGGRYWIPQSTYTKRAFRKQFVKNRAYTDVRILENVGGSVVLELKDEHGFYQMPVTPVTMKSHDGKKVYEEKALNFVLYKKLLERKRKRFDRAVIRGVKSRKYIPKTEKDIWFDVRRYMNDFEKDLKFEDWCVYVDSMSSKIRKLEGAIAASSENVINSLTLDGFGIYNCDIIQRMQNPVTVIAEFRNDIKKELACQNLYVIDKSRNGILQYNASTFSSVKRFTVEGDMNFSLVGITTDGAFCIADMNSLDFDAVERGEKVVIEMNDDVKRSIASVKEELGIN